MSLDFTKTDSVLALFPAAHSDFIKRVAAIASCFPGVNYSEAFLQLIINAGLNPTISKTLTGSPETWTFDVVHGRSGTIATAVDGAAIDAASTISIEYSLVANPAAADWKVYTDGLFTGTEVDKIIEFVGLKNRVVWTPNAGEDLNVLIAL